MIIRSLTRLLLVVLLPIPAFTQSSADPAPGATPASSFAAADVHSSPHANFPFSQPGRLHGDRYVLHQATMVDLISNAWSVDASNVQGGPPWLEMDRFDIAAKVPSATPPADLKLMLQSLLKNRFSLVVHNGTAPMPAWILTADNPKLKPSEGSAAAGCEPEQPPANQPPGGISTITVNCHNTTSDQLAQDLQQMAGGFIDKPIINNTGLQGSFDFQIVWTPRFRLAQAGPDAISIFDAIRKLGLKLELKTAPRPVLLVDSVNETPTPNVPDIAKILPPPPPAQFDVAIIKPAGPAETFTGGIHGDQINLTNIPLKFLISFAWDLNPNDSQVLAGAPPWLDKDHFDILAKVAPDETTGSAPQNGPPMDPEQLRLMLRDLLIERFQMKVHTEDRPIDAYAFTSIAPKLTPANPATRTKCTEGPGPDGKDPRIANPVLGRLLYCRNMTLAEFGQQLPFLASGYIYAPVLDATGLKGAWDFTLSFSPAGQIVPGTAPAAASGPPSNAASEASDPNGAVTLFDAVRKQLGLKLEKQKRPLPVLVIDQINEKPTED
jgi:uncharacterized protein (TIGR03435 family)